MLFFLKSQTVRGCLIMLLTFLSFSVKAQTSPEGVWIAEKNNTKIHITQVNGEWLGKVISSDNKDTEIGLVILKDLKKEGSEWKGMIYAVNRKEWYNVVIYPRNELLELEISVGFLSKSLKWQKSKS
jgi:hypothetical protein